MCRLMKMGLLAQAEGVDFVPMIYGNCCGLEDLPGGLPENATVLLGFNEPNHGYAPGQLTCRMAPL